jgi:DNA polymerase III subunit gamma/tau
MWDVRYRPLRYADVLGQEGNIQLLKSRLKNGTAFDTSYIFAGGYGRGKTTLSRIHARAMLCLDLDPKELEPCNKCENCVAILTEQPSAFSERDAASNGTVAHARAIVEELPYALTNAKLRIYLFDEAQRLSKEAQEVFLKPVEDKRLVGMFCTTEVEKIRGAIRSRCEEYTIRKVTREDILKRMRVILETEKVEYQDDAVLIVIDYAGGHVRDVINGLEMIAQLGPITVEHVREHLHLANVTLYYRILLNLDNPLKAIELVDLACEQVAPEDVASGIAEAAMNTYRLANGMFADFSYVDKALAEQVYAKYRQHVVRLTSWFLGTRYTTKLSLTRDVVVLAQNPGQLPLDGPQPPVVFAGSGTVAQVQAGSVAAAAPTPAPTEIQASAAQTPVLSPNGHQALLNPFADPTPPTETEAPLVNGALPRQRNNGSDAPARPKVTHKTMTPGEWRMMFDRLLRKKSLPTSQNR